jgi:hypothetical protein
MFITNASTLQKSGSLATLGAWLWWEATGDKNKNNVTDSAEPKE